MNKLMPPELWEIVGDIRKDNIKFRGQKLKLEFPIVLANHGNYYLMKAGKHHWAVDGEKVRHYLFGKSRHNAYVYWENELARFAYTMFTPRYGYL